MIPLTETESRLRAFCLQYPKITELTRMRSVELSDISRRTGIAVADLIPFPLLETLPEDEMFAEDESAVISRHPRYLPPVEHRHEFFEIFYVREGTCSNDINGTRIPLQAGDVCIIAPGSVHALAAFSDSADILNILIRRRAFETGFFGIFSDKDALSAFFTHALYGANAPSCLTFHTGGDPEMAFCFEQLLAESASRRRYRNRMMESILSAMFIVLMRNHEKDLLLPSQTAPKKADQLMMILNYLQNNYAHLSLGDLASFFNYSDRQMARILKDNTGQSFGEIQKKLRLHKAAELLETPGVSAAEIIEAVGYADASTFYKAFKQYYGLNPAQYRVSQKGGPF